MICCLTFCRSRFCMLFLCCLADPWPVQRARNHSIRVTLVKNQGCTVFEKASLRCHFGHHFGQLLASLWSQIGTQRAPKSVFGGLKDRYKKNLKKRTRGTIGQVWGRGLWVPKSIQASPASPARPGQKIQVQASRLILADRCRAMPAHTLATTPLRALGARWRIW